MNVLDSNTYESLRREISASCDGCRRKLAALDVVFERSAAPVGAKRGPKPAGEKGAPASPTVGSSVQLDRDAIEKKLCELCRENKVRIDNKGCESCSRKVCQKCRSAKEHGVCKECAALPA